MQGVIGDLVSVCISVKGHLVQAFSGFIKSVLHQDNLAIFGLSVQFRFNQSGFAVIHNIFKLFMYQSELSIKPFRFLVDVSQEVFIGHFVSVRSVVLIIAINHDGGASVWFSSFGSFGFLSCIGLATRDRNIIQSGHRSWWVFGSDQIGIDIVIRRFFVSDSRPDRSVQSEQSAQ